MCLITNDKTKYVATEDITVFKMMSSPYDEVKGAVGRSLIYGDHSYMLGEQPEVEMKESGSWVVHDDAVSDACENILPEFIASNNYFDATKKQREMFISIGAGYHSMTKERGRNEGWWYDVLVECTIPKGAEYYKDMTGLYVSNKLVVNKVVDKDTFK